MNKLKIIFAALLFITANAGVIAQEELPAEEVDVVKDYEITTKEGTRIKTAPEVYEIETPAYKYEYDLDINPVTVEYPAPYILPVAMQADDPDPYYNGFVKASYGSLNNPNFSAQYDAIATDYYTIGTTIDFTRLEESSTENKSYGRTYVDLHGDYFLTQEQKISLKLGGDFQNIHSFGFNQLANDSINSNEGRLSNIFVDATYLFSDPASKLSYGLDLNYDRVSAGLTDQNENDIDLLIHGATKISSDLLFRLGLGINYAKLSNVEEGSDAIWYANPSISFSRGKTGIKLGATFANGSEGSAIFPDAQIRFNLSRQAFILELGAEGEYVQQDLHHLSQINPYLSTLNSIEDSKQYNFYVGMSGHLKKEASYSVRAGYKLMDNLSLFTNATLTDRSLFNTMQDDLSSIYIAGSVNLHPSDKLSVDLGVTKQFLEPNGIGVQDIIRSPFHMVPLLVEGNLDFELIPSRLNIRSSVYLMEGVKFLSTNGLETGDFGVDINFGLDAQIIDRVKLFAEAKNVLSNKYQRWNGYENFGANFLGGLFVKI